MMDSTAMTATGLIAILLGGGGFAALYRAWHDRKIGIRQDARADRESMEARLRDEIKRIDEANEKLSVRIAALEAREEEYRKGIIERDEYIETLRHVIYQQTPPPPPPRPQFTR